MALYDQFAQAIDTLKEAIPDAKLMAASNKIAEAITLLDSATTDFPDTAAAVAKIGGQLFRWYESMLVNWKETVDDVSRRLISNNEELVAMIKGIDKMEEHMEKELDKYRDI